MRASGFDKLRVSAPGVLLLLVCLGIGACSESEGAGSRNDSSSASWRAGDGWLDELGALELLEWPSAPDTPALRGVLAVLTDDEEHVLEASAFREAGSIPASKLPGRMAAMKADWRRWVADTDLSLDPALGPLALTHAGEDMEIYRGHGADQVVFVQVDANLALHWRPNTRQLHAYAVAPPGDVVIRRQRDAPTLERERWLRGVAPHEGVRGLITEEIRDSHLWRGLKLPAGVELGAGPRRLSAERLELVLSHVGESWRLRDGAPVMNPAGLSGVDVELWVERGAERSLAWSAPIEAGQSFVAQSVDLSAWLGEEVALSLRVLARGTDSLEGLHVARLRFAGGKTRAPERPHLIFLDLDTLRADRLGLYGNTPSPSPRLDAWAAEHATVFEDCLATSDWTLPSTVSLLTGLDPRQHGLVDFPDAMTLAHGPLAQRLLEAGYETRARTDAGVVNPAFGFHLGFESFNFERLDSDEHLRVAFDPELEWLAQRESERPAFLFLQTYMLHDPYRTELLADHPYDGQLAEPEALLAREVRVAAQAGELDDEDAAYLLELYDAGIARMDGMVTDMLEALPAIFGDEPYVVLITSDHGEELLDRGGAGHGRSLYQELVHVPLIVAFGDGRAAARVSTPTSGLDVMPTFLELAGLTPPSTLLGHSLLRPLPSERLRAPRHRRNGEMDAAVFRGHKLMRVSDEEPTVGLLPAGAAEVLYELSSDPGERRNVAAERTRERDALRSALRNYRDSLPRVEGLDESSGGAIDEALRKDLQALGYLEDG